MLLSLYVTYAAGFTASPVETFIKGWWLKQCDGVARQRTVAEIEEHRRLLGAGGHCFDLALWVRDEMAQAGISARVIRHDLEAPDSHAGVLAVDAAGAGHLYGLGDLWLQPILVSPEHPAFSPDWQPGFFPGRLVRVQRSGNALEILYPQGQRQGGNAGVRPCSDQPKQFLRACDHSQNLLSRPFCEWLLPHPDTGAIEHWEYGHKARFWNLTDGPVVEEPCATLADCFSLIAPVQPASDARSGAPPAPCVRQGEADVPEPPDQPVHQLHGVSHERYT